MLFSEVYGTYYNVLAEILTHAVQGSLTQKELRAIIARKGYEESILSIPMNLEDQVWPLLHDDLTTPLQHSPTMPLTELQKRWMKTILSDPRCALFDPPMEGLEDVQPLYPADTIVYFDQFLDADPYTDPAYIAHFQTVLTALREKRRLQIQYDGAKGTHQTICCIPRKLEYSQKDDKFRLIAEAGHFTSVLNLARICECILLPSGAPERDAPLPKHDQALVLELTDERNALERCMLHFSHLEKETRRLDEKHYLLTLHYEKEDETELLIRVLSFGQMLKVISPDSFRERVMGRIQKQKKLRTQG